MVGGALKPRRDMATWSTNKSEDSGWTNRFRLQVFTQDPKLSAPRAIQIFVGEASDPHRICISLKQADTCTHGWTAKLNFFAFGAGDYDMENYVMIAVGDARTPHRFKFEIGRHIGTCVEDEGWTEKFVFYLPFRSIC